MIHCSLSAPSGSEQNYPMYIFGIAEIVLTLSSNVLTIRGIPMICHRDVHARADICQGSLVTAAAGDPCACLNQPMAMTPLLCTGAYQTCQRLQ